MAASWPGCISLTGLIDMRTVAYRLDFPQGQQVTIWASAASPEEDTPFHYAGNVDLLPRRFEDGTLACLRVLVDNLAVETGAALTVLEESGTYEKWAE